MTARELQTCTFQGPGASKHHPNSTRRPSKKGKKERKLWRERDKKKAKFWFLPPCGAHFSGFGPHPSAPHVSGLGVPIFGLLLSEPSTMLSCVVCCCVLLCCGVLPIEKIPNFAVAKLGAGQTWFGQSWCWPQMVVPNFVKQLGQCSLGQSSFGQSW